jgi:hypothetical protein
MSETVPKRLRGIARELVPAELGNPPPHIRTVDRLIRRGKLTAYRLGSRVYVTVDSIDKLVAGETAS